MRVLKNSATCIVFLSELIIAILNSLTIDKTTILPRLKIFACALLLQTAAAYAQQNIALNKPAFSSSDENATLMASNAVDGKPTSRWSSTFADNQWIAIDLGANYLISGIRLHWQNSYGRDYVIQVSQDNLHWITIFSRQDGTGGVEELALDGEGRYVRMMGLKRFTRYGFSLFEFAVYGELPPPATNRALHATVTTSSNENVTLQGSFAVDGNAKSRWSSAFADNQWIMIDMGTTQRIQTIKLHWQNSYAKQYRIQFSRDGETWKEAYYQPDSDGGVDNIAINHGGRYLRILCIKRFTRYGFSLFEIEAIGYPVASRVLDALYVDIPDTGNASSSSSSSAPAIPPVTVTPSPSVPLSPPIYDAFEDRIELSWLHVNLPAHTTYYQVNRDDVLIAEVDASQRSFVDYQVVGDQLYRYQVFACNPQGGCTPIVSLTANINSAQQLTLTWNQPHARENGEYLSSHEIGGYEIRFKNLQGQVVKSIVIAEPGCNHINIGQNSGALLYDIATFDKRGLYSMFVAIEP